MNNRFFKLKNYAYYSLFIANKFMSLVSDNLLTSPYHMLKYPPVFFLGAPRCGSTLAFQLITDCFDFGYLSNCHCQYFGSPTLAENLFHPLRNKPCSDYSSRLGITDGNHAPSECADWWNRFFTRVPPYATLDSVEPRKMNAFRKSLSRLTQAIDKPLIFKNLYASFRLHPISNNIPEGIYIVLHRNEIDNGHSILEARMRVHSTYEKWWSMEPPNINYLLTLPAHEQVIEQIRSIHSVIANDIVSANIPISRVFNLHYEDLCSDPKSVILRLQEFFELNNCPVQLKTLADRPFQTRSSIRIDKQLYSDMERYALRN